MPTWETWETITLLESSSFKAVKVAETKDSETTVNSEIEKKSKTVLSA
ncbi:hypothetical protein [Euhalothece natronophila]|nr:hypothetical protein [Euhalothece natronophila]